jgi:hypothetical protein
MHAPISRHPDGSFHSGDREYRLRQSGDHFDVVRVTDGAAVGGFSILGKTAELDAELLEPDVVRAIAEIMSTPRGLLPLQ